MEKLTNMLNAVKQWLYGDSIEDYHDFSWVNGQKLELHIVALNYHSYEYQLFVDGDIPRKALHIPYQWIRVMGEEDESTELDQDLNNCLYWSKMDRHVALPYLKPKDSAYKQCFYTRNHDLVKAFLESYDIKDVFYPSDLSDLLDYCKSIS